MKRLALAALLLAAALAAFLVWMGTRPPLNVVLVVFDTCRADHLGCYGHPGADTPAVDRLAAQGVLFERAYAQVPLTLPSHTTLFTGMHPEYHRIRDNAAYTVPGTQNTLAEILRGQGYTTAAFVGAFPLDRRFGLDQGFETYDGYFPEDPERRAGDVNAALERWAREQSGPGPYFIFVHYYDPHLFYVPPPPFAERFADAPYDGEIAYCDACLAELRGSLRTLCPEDRTLWIFASDHGEGLWEHQEQDHGIFLYDSTVRVPMIWSCPGRMGCGIRTEVIAEIVDVLPTLLEFLEIDIPPSVQGTSLVAVLTGKSNVAGSGRSHAETYYAKLRHGWSGLRSIRTERWTYIEAPRAELYDLRADPGETKNVLDEYPETAASLRKRLAADVRRFSAPADEPAPVARIDPETEARLLSLGYLGRVSKAIQEPGLEDSLISGPDPKDRIPSMRYFARAREHSDAGEWAAAEAEVRKALAIDPDFSQSRGILARALDGQGRYLEAARVWQGLADDFPDDALPRMFQANSLEKAGRHREAAQAYERVPPLLPDPSRGQAEYVLALARMGMWEDFAPERDTLLSMRPLLPETINRLSLGLAEIGHTSAGAAILEESIRLFPNDADAYNLLAWDLIDSGRNVARGVQLAEKAVALDPAERSFLDTLGWGYLKLGSLELAVQTLQRAAEGVLVPEISCHLALAHLANGNRDAAEALLSRLEEEAPDDECVGRLRSLLGRR